MNSGYNSDFIWKDKESKVVRSLYIFSWAMGQSDLISGQVA